MAADLILTLVTDRRRLPGGRLEELVEQAARAGVDQVQLREKDLEGRALHALAAALAALLEQTATRLLINGRPDVARAVGAHGVQLPEQGLPVAAVRQAFPELVIGASCHSFEAARRAQEAGADLVVVGPVLATPGKEHRTLGVDMLRRIVDGLRVPVHAIGGIDPDSAARVVAAGARGLCAQRLFLERPVAQAVRELRRVVTGSRPS